MKSQIWNTIFKNKILKLENPFFIYEASKIRENINCLKKNVFKNIQGSEVYFSVKSNPNLLLLDQLVHDVDGFDVSSTLELKQISKMGVPPARITLSGPGKTDDCLALSGRLGLSCVHLDSYQEWEIINKLKIAGQPTPNISLRLQFGDGPSQYKLGLEEDMICKILQEPSNLNFSGLHSYLGRESFSEKKLKDVVKKMETLISEYRHRFISEPKIYIGPGIPSLSHFDFSSIKSLSKYPITFEAGRAIMSDAGYYGAQVLSVKPFHNPTVILNGGVHHLGSPVLSIFTGNSSANYFFIRDRRVLKSENNKNYTIYGSLCLSHDCIHPRVEGPKDLQRGDWIVFPECGSYGLTAAVPYFIGQDLPEEYLVELDPCGDNPKIKDVTPQLFRSYHECFNL